jgi:8-oxo-dGTP pyrophosphatase MutT (NUDIX family)
LVRPWEVTSTGEEEDFHIFTVQRQVAVSPRTHLPHDFVVVHANDWVNVVAITPDDQVVLVEQYRHGISQVSLEIPGGIIETGEKPLDAGVRELREESGFAGDDVGLLGQAHPNPAYQSNAVYSVLVRNARRVGDLQQDGGEDIAVRLVPLTQIPDLIRNGQITHALVIVAFHFLGLQGI